MSNSSSASGVDSLCGLEFEPVQQQPTILDRMDEVRRLALRYQVIVDWSEELGFVAACTEVPNVAARSNDIDSCVERLFDSLAWHIAGLRAEQRALPMPRPWAPRNSMMRMAGSESITSGRMLAASFDDSDPIIAPPSDQLIRMAEWTANQFRMLVSVSNGSFTALSPEVSNVTGFGGSAGECVADLRVKLVSRVAGMLETNMMPPEPIQEIERRSAGQRSVAA